ncbi:MAG: cold shock domain-containing protein [Candidatus Caccosoma sp.]|nr:cold shock domain-containing protein [Candidatus Caccosoma sp.]
MVGKVKTFNKQKGYGFIKCDELAEDIFFHYSSLKMDGFKTIDVDADVEFDLEESNKGKRATNIKVIAK